MLKTAARLGSLAAVLAAVALTILTVQKSDVFRECVRHVKHTESTQQHKENTPGFASRAITRLETNWVCTWEFIEKRDKAIVAFFTMLLSVSTILLWIATDKLYRAGERQLDLTKRS